MTQALIVSNVLLWLCVVGLSLVVWALVRQLGVLHERLAPVGALAPESPLTVGEQAPRLAVPSLAGGMVGVGEPSPAQQSTLLFFVSPNCPICKTLIPTVLRMDADEGDALRVVFASDGDAEAQRRLVADFDLDENAYVLSRELGMSYHVGKLPYAVLIDGDGIVRSKGLVNTREHVESLFHARDHGVASIQEYVARKAEREAAGGTR